MKKTLKKIFNIVWHVLVAGAFCGFIVLPFLHNTINKTLGQWLWYPCLVIFLVYSFIPNKKMKEQSKFVQISSSGGILQLLFIISGIFVINYYTWVSIEPYPTPNMIDQSLEEILKAVSFADKIIFGRLHYNKEVSAYKKHKEFFNEQAKQVIEFCKQNKKAYHIKNGTITE